MASRGGARAHVRIDRTVDAVPDALRGKRDGGLFDAVPTQLFLVDGGNLLWRAAHSHPAPFPAVDGRDLTPLFRFITKLRQAVGTYGVFAECIVCFDGAEAWSERVALDATYKGNRSYDSKDLTFMGWLPEIRAALDCAGVANIEIADSEADDVIATLVTKAGRPARILSTDRDYFQLISATTWVVNPKSRPALVDDAAVAAQYGVTPSQWCDVRALAGDPSDGIPGVPGIGMTRAAALLRGGRTIDDVRDDATIAPHWDDLQRWRELIRLRTDVAVGYEPTGTATPRLPSPSAVCAELGLIVEQVRPRAPSTRPRGARRR
jgi:DNA polymerase-1